MGYLLLIKKIALFSWINNTHKSSSPLDLWGGQRRNQGEVKMNEKDSIIRVSVSKRYKVSLVAPKGFIFKETPLRSGNYLDEEELSTLKITLGGKVMTFETSMDYNLTGEDYTETLTQVIAPCEDK